MSTIDNIKSAQFEWEDDNMSIGIIAQDIGTVSPGFGAVPPAMPIGSITTISTGTNGGFASNYAISGSNLNTIRPSSSLTIASETPILHTNKHSINIDEFYEDLIAIKQIMIEMAKDEDLMERNAVIRDILSTWLIKGLSK
jgi:hypothetical protein